MQAVCQRKESDGGGRKLGTVVRDGRSTKTVQLGGKKHVSHLTAKMEVNEITKDFMRETT